MRVTRPTVGPSDLAEEASYAGRSESPTPNVWDVPEVFDCGL